MVRQEDWRRDHPATNPAEREVTALGIVQVHLSGRDLSFANSLIEQFNARGSLSEKQLYWVRELTKRAQAVAATAAPQQAPAAKAYAPQPATTFPRIVELFAKAGRRAAIVFHTEAGAEFRLSVAGERSQQPGSINVTDAASGFDDRIWYGRIATSGGWQPSRKVPALLQAEVEAALSFFNTDPAAAAASYGHATNSCCFCRRELTDERSVSVGYGPVCAGNFGLPWGEVTGPKPENKLTCEVPF
jgi:hypothetical protein